MNFEIWKLQWLLIQFLYTLWRTARRPHWHINFCFGDQERLVKWRLFCFISLFTMTYQKCVCMYVCSGCVGVLHLRCWLTIILTTQRKTAVTPLLTHWSYSSLALSHRYAVFYLPRIYFRLVQLSMFTCMSGQVVTQTFTILSPSLCTRAQNMTAC